MYCSGSEHTKPHCSSVQADTVYCFSVLNRYAKDLLAGLTRVTPFLLGFYVKLALTRWWALRTMALGKIMDATSNLNMLITFLCSGEEHKQSRDRFFRWTFSGQRFSFFR